MSQDLCGHILLIEWAAWAGERNMLGLPSRSTTERAREGGMERGACSPEGPMPRDIRMTDEAVARIRITNPTGYRVIKLFYLHGHTLGGIAKLLGISRYLANQKLGKAQKSVKLERQRDLSSGIETGRLNMSTVVVPSYHHAER